MLCTHKTTILCQFGLIICHQLTNSYLHQFSTIFSGNHIRQAQEVEPSLGIPSLTQRQSSHHSTCHGVVMLFMCLDILPELKTAMSFEIQLFPCYNGVWAPFVPEVTLRWHTVQPEHTCLCHLHHKWCGNLVEWQGVVDSCIHSLTVRMNLSITPMCSSRDISFSVTPMLAISLHRWPNSPSMRATSTQNQRCWYIYRIPFILIQFPPEMVEN